MTELEKQLMVCLMELLSQVDEDCPHEYRTEHLLTAMQDAKELIELQQQRMKRMPT
jgi:hypothetical protein